MTLFKSEHRSPRYISMTGDLKSSRPKAGSKRPSSAIYGSDYDLDYDYYQDDLYNRVYSYQRVPTPINPVSYSSTVVKRTRSSANGLRHARERRSSEAGSRQHSSSSRRAKLRMDELQTIKRELTLIKVQVDGLLDSLDRMDGQTRDSTGSVSTWDGSLATPPHHSLLSSPDGSPSGHSPRSRTHRDRESPELGEASDDDHRMMDHHSSDLEDDM